MNNSLDLTNSAVYDLAIEKGKSLNKYFYAVVPTGDTTMPFQFAAYSGATLTVKKSPNTFYNSLQLTTAGSIELLADGVFRFVLDGSETGAVKTGQYVYSMTLYGTGSTERGFLRGKFNVVDESYGEIPNDNSDSPIQITVKPNYVYVESVLNYISGATNLGSGEGIYSAVQDKTLQLKSIAGSSAINVSGGTDTISISLGISPITGATNIGSGQGIYSATAASKLQLKTIKGGNKVSVIGDSDSIQVSFTGISTTITGATNGLSVAGNKTKLGGTLTGATAIVASTANTLTVRANGLLTTTNSTFILTNDTDASLGVQQNSPVWTLRGRGWATTGSISRTVEYKQFTLPVQGTTNPTGSWNLVESINGGAPTTILQASSNLGLISNAGVVATPGAVALNLNAGGGSLNLKVNASTTVLGLTAGAVDLTGYLTMSNSAPTVNGSIYMASGNLAQRAGGADFVFLNAQSPGFGTGFIPVSTNSWTFTRVTSFTYASSILSVPGKQVITQSTSGIALAINTNSQSFSAHLDAAIKQTGAVTGAAITGAEFAAIGVHGTISTAANTDQKLYVLDARPTLTLSSANGVGYGVSFTPASIAGTQLASSTVRAWNHSAGAIVWGSVLSASTISTTQTNYDPAGLTNATAAPYGATGLRLKSTSGVTITSIAGGVHGRVLVVINANAAGGSNITLSADDGSTGTASNRFATAITVVAGECVTIFYDGYSSRWRRMS